MNKRTLAVGAVLVGVVVLAGFFRLYDLENYPPGLFPDEAANGEDALLILDGDWRPFYPRGNGREGLFFFMQATSLRVFGIGVWQMHLVPALVGVATVLAMYFATRPWFGRFAGILVALFLATNHWHVTMSRTGFRAILIPLFVALFTAFVGATIQSAKRDNKLSKAMSLVYAGLAGAAFAGGFYTYIAYRVMIGVVVGIAGLLVLAAIHPKIGFPHFRRYGKQMVVAVVAGVIVLLPLAWFFVQEPEAFVGRAGQVSVFNKELQDEYGGGTLGGTILYSTRETLLSFFAGMGDLNWRHNVAGYPLLNPLVGVLFLLGLAWAINGTVSVLFSLIKGKEVHLGMVYPYVLLILVGMLAPVITTAEGMPHGLRSVGLVVPIFLLAGTAGSVVVYWIKRKVPEIWRSLAYGIFVGLLVLGVVYDGALYFLISRNDAQAHYSYRADLTQVASYIKPQIPMTNDQSNPKPQIPNTMTARPYLVLDRFSLQTIHFLTHKLSGSTAYPTPHDHVLGDETHPEEDQHWWIQLEPEYSHLTPLAPGEIIIFTQSTLPDADRYEKTHQEIQLVEKRYNRWGQEIMRVYQGTGGAKENTPSGVLEGLDA